jgi:hypothetical protein
MVNPDEAKFVGMPTAASAWFMKILNIELGTGMVQTHELKDVGF